MIRRVVLTLVCCGCIAPADAAEMLIPRGSVWRYIDDGSDQPAGWRTAGFAPAWKEGGAPLGFRDDERLAGGTVIEEHGRTTYFRHPFDITPEQLGRIRGLRLRVRRSAGVLVFLNDVEIWRYGIDPGPVGPDERGRANGDQDHFYEWHVGAGHLRPGNNVLAVRAHKSDKKSIGMIFDLELEALHDEIEVWRGPYLQRCTVDGVTVRFRTGIPVAPILRYGPSPDRLDRELRGPETRDHELVLNGLDPTTRYYYAIDAEGRTIAGGDANHFFATHPRPGQSQPLRIWLIGDSGEGQFSGAPAVLESFMTYSPEAPSVWVTVGDNAYRSGTDEGSSALCVARNERPNS